MHILYLVVIFFGKTHHRQYIQYHMVKWWHPSCWGLRQWARNLCSHHWKVCTVITTILRTYRVNFPFNTSLKIETRLYWFSNYLIEPEDFLWTRGFFIRDVSVVHFIFSEWNPLLLTTLKEKVLSELWIQKLIQYASKSFKLKLCFKIYVLQ